MHFLTLILTAAFWAALPVKLVAIAGIVYVVLQAIKAKYPAIGGTWAIVLNGLLTFAGLLSVAHPGDISTAAFWSNLLLTIAGSAGLHGTVRSLTQGSQDPAPAQTSNVGMKAAGLVLAFAVGFAVTGCALKATATTTATAPTLPAGAVDQTDANAFKVLRPAHDFAASISADIQSGKLTVTATQKTAVTSMNKALNIADAAEQSYHKAGGGSTAALTAALNAVLSAWSTAQTSLAAQ
jgi:hypothetical protein